MKHSEKLAKIVHWLGRDFLKVGGITVAMEGDTCREATIWGSHWTPEMLREAARKINRLDKARTT